MKRLGLLLVMFGLLYFVQAPAVERMVIGEVFTNWG